MKGWLRMNTTADLTATLAQALGLLARLVEETAKHLREAGMLPDDPGAEATPEHAVTLLLGLMVAPEPKDAGDCVRLYRQLPFDKVMCCEQLEDGRFGWNRVDDTNPVVANVRHTGETFGCFLVSLIQAYNNATIVNIEPAEINIGGGLGTASASVPFWVLTDEMNVAAVARFSLEPLGGDRHPDDAPQARLDCHATVPGTIFTVFRTFFTGHAEGPREVNWPHAAVADLISEARS